MSFVERFFLLRPLSEVLLYILCGVCDLFVLFVGYALRGIGREGVTSVYQGKPGRGERVRYII